MCKCDCGNMTKLPKYKLESGHTKSCGCYAKEFSKKNFENHQQFRRNFILIKRIMIKLKWIDGMKTITDTQLVEILIK